MTIDTLTLTALVVVTGVANFLLRGSFLLLFSRVALPGIVQRALRYVPAAVFAALVVPELVLVQGSLSLHLSNAKLLAGIAAGIVAWRTRSTVATIVAGMVMLHVTRAVFPA